MAAKSENANSGCFSAVLRRILCSGDGAPTHPSDDCPTIEPDSNTTRKFEPKIDHMNQQQPQKPAGVVARLMGLDSLPADTKWVPLKAKSPPPFLRSRSVNFMDYLNELDLNNQTHHRRVRTSVSFREVPGPHVVNHETSDNTVKKHKKKKSKEFIFVYLENENQEEGVELEAGLVVNEESKNHSGENTSLLEKKKKKTTTNKDESEKGNKENKVSKLRDEPRRVRANQRRRQRSDPRRNHGTKVTLESLLVQDKANVPNYRESCVANRKQSSKPVSRKRERLVMASRRKDKHVAVGVHGKVECSSSSSLSVPENPLQEDKAPASFTSIQKTNSPPKTSSSKGCCDSGRFHLLPRVLDDPFVREPSPCKIQTIQPAEITAGTHREEDELRSVRKLAEEGVIKSSSWLFDLESFREEISVKMEQWILGQLLDETVRCAR